MTVSVKQVRLRALNRLAPIQLDSHPFSSLPALDTAPVHPPPVQHGLATISLQPKLVVNTPGDVDEQEAERVAGSITRQLDLNASSDPAQAPRPVTTLAQSLVQRSAFSGMPIAPDTAQAVQAARGGGQALPVHIRQRMGAAFGTNFEGVQLHTDQRADGLNRALNARAFTVGQDIFFRHDEYQPNRRTGQELLAHELTHVVQQSAQPTIQRAIVIGANPVPRSSSINLMQRTQLINDGLWTHFTALNDDRSNIYTFATDDQLQKYLKDRAAGLTTSPHAPTVTAVPSSELAEAHRRAQDLRFSAIYQPAPHQIPATAPGAHTIPAPMMPPAGERHHWMQAPNVHGGAPHYRLFQNRLNPPAQPTVPLTNGAPNAPSLGMYQHPLNLGMHIQPAPTANLDPTTRSGSSYGGLASVSGRVRGHPYALEQTQRSTTPGGRNFDRDPRWYTDESDATEPTGGVSTYRYSQIEKPSIRRNQSFTQINHQSVLGPMRVARPRNIYFRRADPGMPSGYDDINIDNTGTTDYRNAPRPANVRQQAHQTTMGRAAAVASPYPAPPIHQPGQDFDDPARHSYPGYRSPPPSPLLTDSVHGTFSQTLPGDLEIGQQVTVAGYGLCQVMDVTARSPTTTDCVLMKVPTVVPPVFS